MKKCPYCAEEIQDEAIKCKHCGSLLQTGEPPPVVTSAPVADQVTGPSSRTKTAVWIGAVAAVTVAALILLVIHVHGGSSTGNLAAAQDRAAQSELRNAMVAAKVMYTDNNSYAGVDSSTSGLVTVEPSLCYVSGDTPSVGFGATCDSGQGDASVSVFVASDSSWSAARMSDSGTCFWIKDDSSVGTTYGSGTPCTGSAAQGASAPDFP